MATQKEDKIVRGADLSIIGQSIKNAIANSRISAVEVSVDSNVGTPSGSATLDEGMLSLSFQNLKGEKGDDGESGGPGPQGEKGDKGDTGVIISEQDFLGTIVNDLTSGGDTKALTAEMGKILNQNMWAVFDKMKTNIELLYDSFANMAFENAKPKILSMELPETGYAVTMYGSNCSFSSSPDSIASGSQFSATVTANEGYTIFDVVVKMGNIDITSSSYDNESGEIFIDSASGPIYVKVVAYLTTLVRNPVYKGVCYFPKNGGMAALRLPNRGTADWCISPMCELTGSTASIQFSGGAIRNTDNLPSLLVFDEDYVFRTFYSATDDPRTVSITVSETAKYVRIVFSESKIADAFIYNRTTGEYLFNGSDESSYVSVGWESFYTSPYMIESDYVNSRGDFIGWNFRDMAGGSDYGRSVYPAAMMKMVGVNSQDSQYGTSIGKWIDLPSSSSESISIEFSCVSTGTGATAFYLCVANPETGAAAYFINSSSPRTVTVSSNYKIARLYFATENYANCYIKDATNDIILWEGASTE